MGQIRQLDAFTIEQIAAGEVIERPASVVKELIENAIDAKASRIDIAIKNGGISEIIIRDNGTGIAKEDCVIAFSNHATSKLSKIDDLHSLLTMGFRGEALSSIAAISKVALTSKPQTQEHAYRVEFAASKLQNEGVAALSDGTQVVVRDLFYNVPARYKFLKKDQGEVQAITRIVTEEALAAPEIAFTLTSNDKLLVQTPGNNDLLSTVQALFGSEVADNLVKINSDDNYNVRCHGYISKANLNRKSRRMEYFFINKRSFNSALVTKALEGAMQLYLMTRTFPVAFLFLDLAPNLVDVNVHPRKLEVRFWNENEVYRAVYNQVKLAMVTSLANTTSLFTTETASRADEVDKVEYAVDKEAETVQKAGNNLSSFLNHAMPNSSSGLERASNENTITSYTEAQSTSVATKEIVKPFVKQEKEPVLVSEKMTKYQVDSNNLSYHKQQEVQNLENLIATFNLASTDLLRIDGQRSELTKLKTADYIGQLHGTYLLFNAANCLFIVDQHAMHERINFEKLCKAKITSSEPEQLQQLLLPYEFTLSIQDALLLKENLAILAKHGYIIKAQDEQHFALQALNVNESNLNLDNLLQELISDLDTSDKLKIANLQSKEARLLATRACRSAIMANDYVTADLVKKLLPELLACENPFQCPHGRPTLLQLKRSTIEKAFKRKL